MQRGMLPLGLLSTLTGPMKARAFVHQRQRETMEVLRGLPRHLSLITMYSQAFAPFLYFQFEPA
jgi:hypothetical protein